MVNLLELVAAGERLKIYALVRSGQCTVRAWLETIDGRMGKKKDRDGQRIKARYLRYFTQLANAGHCNAEHMLDSNKPPGVAAKGIYEFRDIESKTRILAFQAQPGMVLANAVEGKKEDKLSETEINRADEARRWYLKESQSRSA